jgi:two-component system NtrC family sensor kinase
VSGRLLIVDDNAINRDILRRHLVRQGYEVMEAEDGQHGLDLMASGAFDLVMLDVLMPVMDGIETLRRMKADPSTRDTPVIMISALDESAKVVQCIKMGAEDYLMKPFDPVLLGARLGASLEKKRLRDEEKLHAQELQEALNQLRRTQDQLLVQENLASLGALTAGIAHEIKNPLNFVTNFSSAAQDLVKELQAEAGPDASPVLAQLADYLAKIDEHGKRADRIVRGMLMHSRGKSGAPEKIDLKNMLNDCMNLAYHAMRAQDRHFNLRMEMDIHPGTGAIKAVPQEINRVFLNIINNAFYAVWDRKKIEGDGFEPSVRLRSVGTPDYVEVSITDNGPGIPPDVMAKIFNPFFTTKPAGEGTGLGLSLSYEIIVRGHNGTIRAESTPGASTEFIVTLPRGLSANAESNPGRR